MVEARRLGLGCGDGDAREKSRASGRLSFFWADRRVGVEAKNEV